MHFAILPWQINKHCDKKLYRNYAKLAESQSKRQLIQCASMGRQTAGGGGDRQRRDTATNGNQNGGNVEMGKWGKIAEQFISRKIVE